MKKRRHERHMSQAKLSDLSGITVRTISKIECGKMNPSYEILFALVSVLEMSFDSLFASEEDRETEDIRELVVLYNACPEKGRHLIVEAVRTLSKELSNIF